jgi:hypothetical protein
MFTPALRAAASVSTIQDIPSRDVAHPHPAQQAPSLAILRGGNLCHSWVPQGVAMRIVLSLLIMVVLFSSLPAHAQLEPPIVPGARPPGQHQEQELYAEDGGAHGGVLESIVIPPRANAPFTLILETEWVRGLSDGGTITVVNKRRIARDAQGRIYQERWLLIPKNDKVESKMSAIQISDPNTHTLYSCLTLDLKKPCLLITYSPSPETVYQFQGPPSGPLPGDIGDRIHEDLGKQLVAGVEAQGTRDTVHYKAGVFGNDRNMTIEREFWYAPKLGFNLLSKRSDPRIGVQTFTATNLILADPDPKLFELPEGFTVVDRRQTVPAEN